MSTQVQNEELPTRWEIELEFVQSLSNLDYLNYLSHKKYFEDPRFQYYLKYLYNYWKRPENLKYLIYPNCMEILKLLITNDRFKVEIVKKEFRDLIVNDMVEHWKIEKSVDIKNPTSVDTAGNSNQVASGATRYSESNKEENILREENSIADTNNDGKLDNPAKELNLQESQSSDNDQVEKPKNGQWKEDFKDQEGDVVMT